MAIGDNLEPGMGGGGTQDEIWRMRQPDGTIILVNVSVLGGLREALRRYPHLAPVSRQANQATLGQLGSGMVAADPFSVGGMGGNGSDSRRFQPVTPATFGGQLEQQSPFGAFTNFLGAYGLGSDDPRSAARTFAEAQYDPTLAAFRGQQLAQGIDVGTDFDRLPESMGNEFASYAAQGGWNPRQRLADSWRALQAAAPGVAGLAPGEGGFLQAALNPQSATEAFPVFDLARNLQSSRISPLVGRFFQQEDPSRVFARFAAQRAGAGIGGGLNALDFARQQYGLGQLGF